MRAEQFEEHRGALFNLAYRMTGSVQEADDAVQDVWLRVARSDPDRPLAYLRTAVTRRCIDALRSARSRREVYVGPWLPEPAPDERLDLDRVEQAESVSVAFLLLLETLSPAERAAFLLREVCDADYDEIGAALERTPAACRQVLRRARERIDAARPRFEVRQQEHAAVVASFLQAALQQDPEALRRVVDDQIALISDGGGKVVAALRPLTGHRRVLGFVLGLLRQSGAVEVQPLAVNGQPALLLRDGDAPPTVVVLGVVNGRLASLYLMRNPDKLGAWLAWV